MTDSSSHTNNVLDDVEPVPDAVEGRGGDPIGDDPPAVGHEPTPHQENKPTDEESNLLEENKQSNLLEENKTEFRFPSFPLPLVNPCFLIF